VLVRLSHPTYVPVSDPHHWITMPEDQAHGEANRLYWETDASVAEIANGLDISRRALYDAIQPRPAGGACPECGMVVVFRNRTAAERGRAECLECELEVLLEDLAGSPSDTEPQVEQEQAARPLSPMRRPAASVGSGAVLGGSLLAGLALGAAAGYLFRQR